MCRIPGTRGGLLAAALFCFAQVTALAVSNGINGFSGQFGLDCNECHSGGTVPTVTIAGPTQVEPGSFNAYTLTIAINGTTQRYGGLDVSTDGGTLSVFEAGTQILFGEVTHTERKPSDVNRNVIFNVGWEAPLSAGTYTLYGAGNAVNGGQGANGDRGDTTTLAIQVGTAASPGETSGATLAPLLVVAYDKFSGDLELTYDSACAATSNNIYYGPLDQVSSYGFGGSVCDIGTSGAYPTFNPGPGSYYFLVVGTSGADQGSYGSDRLPGGSVDERPDFAAGACGQVQTLANRCD